MVSRELDEALFGDKTVTALVLVPAEDSAKGGGWGCIRLSNHPIDQSKSVYLHNEGPKSTEKVPWWRCHGTDAMG